MRESTAETYEAAIRLHIVGRAIGALPLSDVGYEDVNALCGELAKCERPGCRHDDRRCPARSTATIHSVHSVLRAGLQDAVRWRLIPSNPVLLAHTPRSRQHRRRSAEVWTPEEVGRFLNAARDDRLYAMWYLGATTGMRRGELCALPWYCVDLRRGRLVVQRQLNDNVVGPPQFRPPKSPHSWRTILLDQSTIDVLREHRARWLGQRFAAGAAWHDTDIVFCKLDGGYYHPASVSARFEDYRQAAGLQPGTMHTLRHTAATLMLNADPPLPVPLVAAQLGISVLTTLETYAHAIAHTNEPPPAVVAHKSCGRSIGRPSPRGPTA